MAKFFRRGVSLIDFLPAVASLSAVTDIEVAAGTELTPGIAAIGGFQLTNAPIALPNLADIFTPQITGEDTVADSSLTFNDDNSVHTIRIALAKGTAGFILLRPYGAAPTKRNEVWPVKVTGFNDEWSVDNTGAKAVCGFAVTATPAQNGINEA
jgi:hypothetical protein